MLELYVALGSEYAIEKPELGSALLRELTQTGFHEGIDFPFIDLIRSEQDRLGIILKRGGYKKMVPYARFQEKDPERIFEFTNDIIHGVHALVTDVASSLPRTVQQYDVLWGDYTFPLVGMKKLAISKRIKVVQEQIGRDKPFAWLALDERLAKEETTPAPVLHLYGGALIMRFMKKFYQDYLRRLRGESEIVDAQTD